MTLLISAAVAAFLMPTGGVGGPLSTPRAELARCVGCGCHGGPGWRIKETGKCATSKTVAEACGNPPSPKLCTKEN